MWDSNVLVEVLGGMTEISINSEYMMRKFEKLSNVFRNSLRIALIYSNLFYKQKKNPPRLIINTNLFFSVFFCVVSSLLNSSVIE